MINWNGITSDSLNCIVERYPTYTVPRRKQSAISVPGRNGDLLLQQQAYSNYIQGYDIYLSGPRNNSKLPDVARAVAAWLNVGGYKNSLTITRQTATAWRFSRADGSGKHI